MPDVVGAFASLPPMLSKNGSLCVDFYEKTRKSWLLPKYLLRPITKKLPKEWLFQNMRHCIPLLLSLSDGSNKIPWIGSVLKRIVPVVNYKGICPRSPEQLFEWTLLTCSLRPVTALRRKKRFCLGWKVPDLGV